MSIPRTDLRTKVSLEAHEALDAEAEARGIDKSEVVRQLIEGWAGERIHFWKVLASKRRREGGEGRDGE